jgi:acetoin utilization deacetylase AcuC-like enzyme
MVAVYYEPSFAAAAYAFPTTRKARWIADSLKSNPIPCVNLEPPPPLTEQELLTAHHDQYIQAVRTGKPRTLAESNDLKWDPGLWPMVLASNGGAVAAALRALQNGIAGSLSSGLHHARRDQGYGYCTFNGLAIAAELALAAGAGDVLILDLDAHCGGGTHGIIAGNPHIWQIDVSVDPFDRYEPGERTTLDMVANASDYIRTIEKRLRDSQVRRFGLCLYNAGMDPHEDCPVGALAGITDEHLQAREELVFNWCREQELPIAFVMAGGYVSPTRMDEPRLVELHRLTLAAAARSAKPGPTRGHTVMQALCRSVPGGATCPPEET